MTEEQTYTPGEIAQLERVDVRRVYAWLNKDLIKGAYRLPTTEGNDGEWRIPESAYYKFLSKLRNQEL